jgi:outer membrane protein assembly factor BamD
MKKIKSIVPVFAILYVLAVSCNSETKVRSSDDDKKKASKGIAVGKYNKLLKSGDMELKYSAALEYYKKEDYTRALGLFDELVGVFRGTPRAEDLNYYYAYCNYNLTDYIVAGYHFRNFVKNFPNSKHTEECAYMNAYCFYLSSPDYSLDQSDTKVAIKAFQNFTVQYPKSDRIPECNKMLDKLRGKLERKSYENSMLYFNTMNYKSAVTAFNNHMKDFPDSKHTEELHYLIIKSYYLLALNSIDSKKHERFKAAVDSYIKFVDSYPNGEYIKQAEMVYTSALKNLEHIENPEKL